MTRPARLLDTAASNLGRQMPPRLSIDGNRFTLIDGSGNEKPVNSLALDVVFIDLNSAVSKMYWGKDYNPNDTGDIPLCWSDNGKAPSVQAQAPQNPVCMTCPHNAIGSAISKFTGAKIKACVDMKKLAFIVPGDPNALVYLMTVKPGSFKNWGSTINWLKTQKFSDGAQPDLPDVVIRLEFESQGVLKFTPISAVPGNAALEAQREAAWALNITPEIVGANDQPWQGQLAAPAPAQQLPPPAQPVFAPPPQPAAPFNAPQQAAPAFNALKQPEQPEPPKRRRGRAAGATAATGFQTPAAPAATQPALQPTTPPQGGLQTPQVAPASEAGQPADPLAIPQFLRREQPAAPAPAPQTFGMTQPAAPDAGLQDAIDKAFALPT